jgi:hypothetical protein
MAACFKADGVLSDVALARLQDRPSLSSQKFFASIPQDFPNDLPESDASHCFTYSATGF